MLDGGGFSKIGSPLPCFELWALLLCRIHSGDGRLYAEEGVLRLESVQRELIVQGFQGLDCTSLLH